MRGMNGLFNNGRVVFEDADFDTRGRQHGNQDSRQRRHGNNNGRRTGGERKKEEDHGFAFYEIHDFPRYKPRSGSRLFREERELFEVSGSRLFREERELFENLERLLRQAQHEAEYDPVCAPASFDPRTMEQESEEDSDDDVEWEFAFGARRARGTYGFHSNTNRQTADNRPKAPSPKERAWRSALGLKTSGELTQATLKD
eukprot:gene18419-21971_t